GNLVPAHGLPLRRTEHGKRDLVVELFERDFQPHVELERLRRLRAIDDVAHHARALVELNDRDGIGRGEARRGGTMVDDVAVELALAARLEGADLARGAGWAERPRREVDVGAGIATLQAQFAGLGAVPEMLSFRRRFRFGARSFGHFGKSSLGSGKRPFVAVLMRQSTIRRQRSTGARAWPYAASRSACMPLRDRVSVRAISACEISRAVRGRNEMPNKTLATLADDLAHGRTSARKLVEECLARVADPAGEGQRVFIHVDKDAALEAA